MASGHTIASTNLILVKERMGPFPSFIYFRYAMVQSSRPRFYRAVKKARCSWGCHPVTAKMRKTTIPSSCLFLLAVAVYFACPVTSREDEFCPTDNCSDQTGLQEPGEASFQWWDVFSAAKYIISVIKHNIRLQVEKIYNKAADVAEGVMVSMTDLANAAYNQAAKIVEAFYNKTVVMAEGVYNHTKEFAGRVYDKVEELAERI